MALKRFEVAIWADWNDFGLFLMHLLSLLLCVLVRNKFHLLCPTLKKTCVLFTILDYYQLFKYRYLHLHLQWLPTRSYNGHSVGGRSGLIYMVSLVLNSSVLLMSSTAGGSLFHSRMVRGQKLFLYSSQLLWIVRNFMGWDPLVLRSGLWVT